MGLSFNYFEIMSLTCSKCDMKETDYGFEFYRATKCRISLCVFCKRKEVNDQLIERLSAQHA